MKKVLLILGAVLLGIVLVIGGCKVQEKSQKEQMLEIVKSDEAKKVLDRTIKNLEPDAFTSNGVIQSYEIDEKSVKHNPMGGIMVRIYINNKKNLYISNTFSKNSSGKLTISGSGLSSDLTKLLEKEEKMKSKNYTEEERMNIAKEEYTSYVVGQKLTINEGTVTIGTVVDVIDQPDNGLHMTVIRSQTFILPYKISNSAYFIV